MKASSPLPDARAEALPPFSPTLFRWFGRYLRRYFRRHFTAVRVGGSLDASLRQGRPMVVYTNHPSWWDPIFFMLIHGECFPERRMHGPMEAKALEKYGFMRRIGVFGIDLDSLQGARTFLRTSRAILSGSDTALWITAQGRFSDPRERPVELAPGLAHLARSVPDLLIQPVAVEYPFLDERLPEALAWLGEPIIAGEKQTVATWSDLLAERLAATQDTLAAAVAARDTTPFRTLVGGSLGVGGIYDTWRRLKAWSRGRRFEPAHGKGRS